MIFFHRNNKSKNVPWSTDYPDTKLTKSPADSRPQGQIQFTICRFTTHCYLIIIEFVLILAPQKRSCLKKELF